MQLLPDEIIEEDDEYDDVENGKKLSSEDEEEDDDDDDEPITLVYLITYKYFRFKKFIISIFK